MLSISEMWGLVAFFLVMATTLAIFVPEQIEKRVGPKVRRMKAGKGERRLSWPSYLLEIGTKSWFASAIFVMIEIATESINPYIGSPIVTYGQFLTIAVLGAFLAIVPTVYSVMFIINPKDEPPRLARYYGTIVVGICLLALDVAGGILFVGFFQLFNYLVLWAQLFTILLPVSIVCSAFFLWTYVRKEELHGVDLIPAIALISPYALLAIIGAFIIISNFIQWLRL